MAAEWGCGAGESCDDVALSLVRRVLKAFEPTVEHRTARL